MNGSDSPQAAKPASQAASEPQNFTALRQELRYLRTLFVTSLMALIILGFSLNIYVFRQVSIVRKELDASRALLQEYQVKREPLINSFIAGLQEFSKTHPDLTPLLEHYGISPAAGVPGVSSLKPSATSR